MRLGPRQGQRFQDTAERQHITCIRDRHYRPSEGFVGSVGHCGQRLDSATPV